MKNLTFSHANKLVAQVDALKKRHARAIEKSQEVVEHVVHGVECFGSAFAFGMLQGKYADKGGLGVMGVPIELAVGVAGYLAATIGVGGSFSSHLYPIAQGALAAYATTIGRSVGLKTNTALSTPALAPKSTAQVRGSLVDISGEAKLSTAELSALANPS